MEEDNTLFQWFGSKLQVTDVIWARLGQVKTYIEPFFGSGAAYIRAPYIPPYVIINDLDALVSNFWRALKAAPEEVAEYADWPCHEVDLTARKKVVFGQAEAIAKRLAEDPDFYDSKIAGWWVWGQCSSILGNWKSDKRNTSDIPALWNCQGVLRISWRGQIKQRLVQVASRFRHARVACGDWSRVVSRTQISTLVPVGILLDPPYGEGRAITYEKDSTSVITDVAKWAVEHGDDPNLRIALCGYEGNIVMPDSWECYAWKPDHGKARVGKALENRSKERIWFSPHCLRADSQERVTMELRAKARKDLIRKLRRR